TGVGVERVGTDDAVLVTVLAGRSLAVVVLAGPPAFVDAALFVDEEVVTDVVPAPILGVVRVDRTHGGRRIGVVVLRVGVMDDQLADRGEARRRALAHRLVGTPLRPGDHRGLGDLLLLLRRRLLL